MDKNAKNLYVVIQVIDVTDGDEADERGEQGVETSSRANHERLLRSTNEIFHNSAII